MATSTSGSKSTGSKPDVDPTDQTPDVEVSDAGVEVRTTEGGAEAFKPVELTNKAGESRTAATLAEKYALEFDGFAEQAKSSAQKSDK